MCRGDLYIEKHCCAHLVRWYQVVVPINGCGGRCKKPYTWTYRSIIISESPCKPCFQAGDWVLYAGAWCSRDEAQRWGLQQPPAQVAPQLMDASYSTGSINQRGGQRGKAKRRHSQRTPPLVEPRTIDAPYSTESINQRGDQQGEAKRRRSQRTPLLVQPQMVDYSYTAGSLIQQGGRN
ncbi:hypothetical protein LEL_01720 [Akanthomyces lecanii RCEF 1005]|uniref:Uncharacterized protein n=1 Tax=Akanthomyces lecanii RCEF 1005 TaxID=1081108 RepID=A0A169YHM0_CORDF|nr:hypothetical protein LEL_01720 [Akanthomyces lecanii RCEF 1005]